LEKSAFCRALGTYSDGIFDRSSAVQVTGLRGLQNGVKGSVSWLNFFRAGGGSYIFPSGFSLDVKTSVVVISALDVFALTGLVDALGLDGTEAFLAVGLAVAIEGVTCGMVETLTIVGALVSFLTSGAAVFLTGAGDGFLVSATFVGLCVDSFMLGLSDGINTVGFAEGFPFSAGLVYMKLCV
jgi:hypothetical protein